MTKRDDEEKGEDEHEKLFQRCCNFCFNFCFNFCLTSVTPSVLLLPIPDLFQLVGCELFPLCALAAISSRRSQLPRLLMGYRRPRNETRYFGSLPPLAMLVTGVGE